MGWEPTEGSHATSLSYASAVDLRYLYVGSSDTTRDLVAWLLAPGARLRWRFRHFGADVAAIDVGAGPLVLLADHRPAGSVLPIYAVGDLDGTVAALLGPGGWSLMLGPMGTPEGPACVLRDSSGTAIALLQLDRPGALEAAYDDKDNAHAVRGQEFGGQEFGGQEGGGQEDGGHEGRGPAT